MNTEEIKALIYKLTEEGKIVPKMLMYASEIEIILNEYETTKRRESYLN